MNEAYELDIDGDDFHQDAEAAIDLASDQDRLTWLTSQGKRVAAIVPVEVAEAHERMINDVLSAPAGRPVQASRYIDVKVKRSVLRDGDTSTLLNVVLGAMRARAVPLVLLREFRQAVFDAGSYAAALTLAEQTVSFE